MDSLRELNENDLEKCMRKLWKEDWVKVKSKKLAIVVRWLIDQGKHVRSTADVVRLCVELVAEHVESVGYKEWSLADSNLLLMSKGLRTSPFSEKIADEVFKGLVEKKGGLK